MKKFIAIALLIFVASAGWRLGELLSTDALGMALGVIFGMMAGIPAALIALTASRMGQSARSERESQPQPMNSFAQPLHNYPPVIVLAGHPQAQQLPAQPQYGFPALPPRAERHFKMVGDEEGWSGS